MRGLSIEPLWKRIPPADLDLEGIDWVILGGESGSGKLTRPFSVEWAEELRALLALIVLAVGLRMGLGLFLTPDDPFVLMSGMGE